MKIIKKLKCMSKRSKIAFSCAALALLVCVTGVVAYLTDADRANNTLVIGGNRITIEEGFIPPPEMKPGVSFTKNVRIKNTGLSDCYVRVMAVFTTSDMEKFCEVDWNTEAWTYNEADGYWYYPYSIAKGEKTPSLFTKVTVKERYDFNDDGVIADNEQIPASVMQDFDIIVYAESYQSAEFSKYQDAWAHYQVNKPG